MRARAAEGLRALVADDDTDTCLNVSKMLRTIGMRADWTTSGREAVVRAQDALDQGDGFRVFIIDWMIPDMNGLEVVRRVRKMIGEATPIIILTAYDWTDIEVEARDAGVTAFCAKPLFLSELRRVLAEPFRMEEQAEQTENAAEFAGKRLLVVEDNALNREIAVTMLEEAGFAVDTAENGKLAVDKVRESAPGYYDLVLMDIQMPVMNGYEATKAIRRLNDPTRAQVPILAMTADAFEEDRQKALRSGWRHWRSRTIVPSAPRAIMPAAPPWRRPKRRLGRPSGRTTSSSTTLMKRPSRSTRSATDVSVSGSFSRSARGTGASSFG